MIIYVITRGKYSDYHICAVTTEKEVAEDLKRKFSDWDEARIEKYDTETYKLYKFEKMYYCYNIDGITKISETDFSFSGAFTPKENKNGDLWVYVNADNEQDALKIASDKFAKYRAEQLGL